MPGGFSPQYNARTAQGTSNPAGPQWGVPDGRGNAGPGMVFDQTTGTWTHTAPPGYRTNYDAQGNPSFGRSPASVAADFSSLFPSLGGLTGGGSGGPGSGPGPLPTVQQPGYPGGGGSGGGGGGGAVQGPTIASIAPPDSSAATAAAFAHAKDKVGGISRASLDALTGELGAQGMLGGGAQVQGTQNLISAGAGQLGDVSRQQAIEEADIARDFAKTSYQGGITQRGQDITSSNMAAQRLLDWATTGYQGGITQRGQDYGGRASDAQRQDANMQRQIELWKLMMSGLNGGGGGGYY